MPSSKYYHYLPYVTGRKKMYHFLVMELRVVLPDAEIK